MRVLRIALAITTAFAAVLLGVLAVVPSNLGTPPSAARRFDNHMGQGAHAAAQRIAARQASTGSALAAVTATPAPTTIPTAPSTPLPAPSQPSKIDGAAPNPSLAVQNATHDHVMGTVSAAHGAIATKPTTSSGANSTPGAATASPTVTPTAAPAASVSNAATVGGSIRLTATTELASSPSSSYAAGFDISAWQSNSSIDWAADAAAGAKFVYIKATEGTGYASSQFGAQWASASAAGLIRGAYVFATPNTSSGAATADYLVAHGAGWSADGKTLPPLLDIENNPYAGGTCYGLSTGQMTSWISDFSNEIHAKTGRYPALYTNISWWQQCTGNSAAFGADPYMPAYWPSTNFSGPGTLGASWQGWNLWQWADAGSFPGDQDVFNGSLAGLQAFAADAGATTAAPPIGSIDKLQGGYDAIAVAGWAADPSTTASTSIALTVDATTTRLTATGFRPDVAAVYPAVGSSHGYSTTIAASPGSHQVCVTAYAATGSGSTLLGCSTVTVKDGTPFGSFDVASTGPAGTTVAGWVIDPDATSPTTAQMTIDGGNGGTFTAGQTRPDLGRVYPA